MKSLTRRKVLLICAGLVACLLIWNLSREAAAPLSRETTPPPPLPHPALSVAAAPLPTDASAGGFAVPNRLILGSAWKTDPEATFAAFAGWTERYLAAAPDERVNLLAEGVRLARERRSVLADLIRDNPEHALAVAVPVMIRRQLPESILDLLEERVSGAGELALLGATPAPGGTVEEATFRTALIGGREFKAYAYGRRAQLNTLPQASILGIALDGLLAVSDSPVRVLETGEPADGKAVTEVCPVSGITTEVEGDQPLNLASAAPTAIEVNGKIEVMCEPDHVIRREQTLAHEENGGHTVVAGNNLPGTSGVVGRPAQAWTHGTKKLLVIRVDFSDLPGVPLDKYDGNAQITDTYVTTRINGSNGVRDFYTTNSFGKTTLSIADPVGGDSADVSSVLRMPQTAAYYAQGDGTSHYSGQLHTDARNAAATAGIAVDTYDRVGVVFSNLSSIANSKITYGGLGSIEGRNFWINGYFTFGVVTHEIGHNYGLQHSNLWNVSDGNPISPTGTSIEYGDVFDIMGGGGSPDHHFSHWNKSILQWIPDTGVPTISTGGVYRVFRFDHASSNLANSLALKVVRNREQDYWIGLRRATSNASMDGGAYVLWGYNDNRQGNLLDLTNPVNDTSSAALAVGATFTDAAAGITLQPLAQGGSGADEWLDVQVTLQPRLSWAQDVFVVDEQVGTATLTLSRESNATGSVSVSYATSNGTATAPADYTTTSGTVTWAAGDLAPKTITIPVIPDAVVEGSENFTVTLSAPTGGSLIVNNATATVTIADPGSRDTTYFPEFANSTAEKILPLPDGSAILGGWFGTVQDAAFNVYSRGGVTRVLANGAIDPAFAEEGGFGAFNGSKRIAAMARQPDGKILIGGEFTSFNGQTINRIARLNSDGTLDTTFSPGTGPDSTVYALLLQPDGKIVIGGAFLNYNGATATLVARLNADGSRDTTFTAPPFQSPSGWRVESLALQPDGKLLIGGVFYFNGANFKAGLCRVTTSGSLDSTFTGVVAGAHAAGSTSSLRSVSDIKVEMDGRILVAGDFSAFNGISCGGFVRLTASGAVDGSLTPSGTGTCNSILVQPDGRILIGGQFSSFNGTTVNNLVRISTSGVVESTFVAAGGAGGTVKCLALQPDGKVLVAGSIMNFQGAGYSRPYWRFFGGLLGLPGTVQFGGESFVGIEGTNATVTVTRAGGSSGVLSVGYATLAGSAGTSDFTPTSGTLTWTDGDSSTKTISIPITSDGVAEGQESFLVHLGQPIRNSTLLGAVQRANVSVNAAFDSWRSTYFTPLELSDSNISGDLADPDGDGLSNLLEFGLSLDPRSATGGSGALPASMVQDVGGTNYLTLSFKRRTPALDLSYSVQTNAGTLAAPDWLSNAVQVGSATSNVDGTETVTFRDVQPASGNTRRFMRVQVVRTP